MAPPRGTRKDPLFVILLITSIIVLTIFCLCASKVAKELKVPVRVFWAVLYTIALSVVTCCYQTVYVAYYVDWSLPSQPSETHSREGCSCEAFMVTLVFNFTLGIAWILAVVAQLFDPNDTDMNDTNRGLESSGAFKGRVAGSGVVAIGMLSMAIVSSLRSQCVMFGNGIEENLSYRSAEMAGNRYDAYRERGNSDARPVEIQEAEMRVNGQSTERASAVRVVLEKIGIGRVSGR
ncbi:hypothetical protein RUND412_003777 [Rhizina undulata]